MRAGHQKGQPTTHQTRTQYPRERRESRMPLNIEKWLRPGYEPSASGRRKRSRTLPPNYRAFNLQREHPSGATDEPNKKALSTAGISDNRQGAYIPGSRKDVGDGDHSEKPTRREPKMRCTRPKSARPKQSDHEPEDVPNATRSQFVNWPSSAYPTDPLQAPHKRAFNPMQTVCRTP